MRMKQIIPMVMIASTPLAGTAQSQSGIKTENLDTNVKPANDFYQYSTGGWQKLNPLPAAYSRYGSFDVLQEDNNKRINNLLSDLLKKNFKEGTTERKLSDLYKMAMDSVRRNEDGVKPVLPLLNEIEIAQSVDELRKIQLKYIVFGYGIPMSYGFGADEKNAGMNILSISQGGLTLGQKEYYLDNDKATKDIRNAFKEHISRMFQLFGFSKEKADMKRDAIIRFETSVALVSKSQTELRDVEANYNKMTLAQFKDNYPNINLEEMAVAEGIDTAYIQEMVVGQPTFLSAIDKLTSVLTADDMKAIMQWDAIMSSANYLDDTVRSANFDFFGKVMRGRKEDFPLWKRATSQVENQMGEALGKMYCAKYFPESSKKRMELLVKNLQKSLGERIMEQDWMSEETKKAALDKLSTFYVKIGYPNTWKDLTSLNIDTEKSYYDNIQECRIFWDKYYIEKNAGKPVDKDEWFMNPQTVNAY